MQSGNTPSKLFRKYKPKGDASDVSSESSYLGEMKRELESLSASSFYEELFEDKMCTGSPVLSKAKATSSNALQYLALSPLIRHSM